MYKLLPLTAALMFTVACGAQDSQAPSVVSTLPVNGSTDVDPELTELLVTFDEAMTDGNWSWAYTSEDTFPTMTGQPSYSDDLKTNTLPVKLESGKAYEIWINSEKFKNFKDTAGNSSAPYKWVFTTR